MDRHVREHAALFTRMRSPTTPELRLQPHALLAARERRPRDLRAPPALSRPELRTGARRILDAAASVRARGRARDAKIATNDEGYFRSPRSFRVPRSEARLPSRSTCHRRSTGEEVRAEERSMRARRRQGFALVRRRDGRARWWAVRAERDLDRDLPVRGPRSGRSPCAFSSFAWPQLSFHLARERHAGQRDLRAFDLSY